MKRSGVAAGLAFALFGLTLLGACGPNASANSCGANGATNGTCQPGPSCPSGSVEIPISDPFDSCGAGNMGGGAGQVCCVAAPDAVVHARPDGSSIVTGDTGITHPTDATTGVDAPHSPDAAADATMPVDGGHDAGFDAHIGNDATSANDTGSGVDALGPVDASHVDASHVDAGHDSGKACDGGSVCSKASDCPTPAAACVTATCSDGCCGTTPADVGTACSNGGRVCDGNETCVGCEKTSDCPTPATVCVLESCDMTTHACVATNAALGTTCNEDGVVCNGGACVSSHCSDGLQDADETDVDCGGSCGATCSSTPAEMCKVNGDCTSLECSTTTFQCQAPTCGDGIKNGNETGVDCGGADCDALGKTCDVTKGCKTAADCTTGMCTGGFCALADNGVACASGTTCANGNCVGGVCCDTACSGQCQACTAVLNGGTDGTCGHRANGTTCDDGNACTTTDTCQSGTCTGSNPVTCGAEDQCHTAGVCDTGTGACSNPMAMNGATCDLGNACYTADSCTNGTCTGTFCSSTLCGSSLSAFTGTQTAGWNFNASASYDQTTQTVVLVDGLSIVEAGTAIYDDPITADAFTASFDFKFTTTNGRADGMAFIIETNGPDAIGQGFGGFGALGLDGYGVELDIFDSNTCDPGNGNHAGVDLLSACTTNGGIPSPLATSNDLYDDTMANHGVGDIGDGSWRTATITLANSALSVSITGSTGTVIPVANLQAVALTGFVPGTPYYFGFGAGSGSNAMSARAEIRNVSISFPAQRCL